MRRLLYTVAAVLALAPLAAVAASAPASAAVQHPSAAQTICSGNEYGTWYDDPGNIGPSNYSYWYAPSGIVNAAHANSTQFCRLSEGTYSNNPVYAYRQYGTSNCATWDGGSVNRVKLESCNPSNVTAQEWQMTHPGQSPQQGHLWTLYQSYHGPGNYFLEGDGGNMPVYFNYNGPDQSINYWYWDCMQNC